jgi:phenylalanyl-tRNA synthetase beta chain
MKISYNWLKDYIDVNLPASEAADLLTHVGLEVENISTYETAQSKLEGLMIGKVMSAEKHPNADKLSVTKVDVGNVTELQIVCGATNVGAGQKVIVALQGTLLHPFEGKPFKIKKSKIRGVESEGMICAEDEIGLSSSHSGIMVLPDEAPIGMWARDFMKVRSDDILEIGLTPNRGDAMSHIGVARDLIASLRAKGNLEVKLKLPSVDEFSIEESPAKINVQVEDAIACPRFSGVVISGITVGESPEWLVNKLKSVGLRPINNIVDVTNFVMLEGGQPLHAYDFDEIEGCQIVVKTMPEGTIFKTLDDKEVKLRNNDLMVCSAVKPMGIAGIYGGISSGVKASTTRIFLESACWNPKWIRRTSTHHNLKTDAAAHFEKGTDPNGTIYALKRAALLIQHLAGGKISSELVDIVGKKSDEKIITLSWEKLNRISGIEIPKEVVAEILMSLSFTIISANEHQIVVGVPTFKTDILRSEDVMEEILRIYGYDQIHIPTTLRSSLSFLKGTGKEMLFDEIAGLLASCGFREMVNNSITNSKYQEQFFPETKDAIVGLLSFSNIGLDSLRASMLFPALEVVRYNHNRKSFDLKLFEFGKSYLKQNLSYKENACISVLVTGALSSESWIKDQQPADFYFLKEIIYNILKKSGIKNFSNAPLETTIWPQGLIYRVGKTDLVTFGKLNEVIAATFDLKPEIYYAEIDADALLNLANNNINFTLLPKFPAVRRDLALVIDDDVVFGEIESMAYSVSGKLLKEVNLFDVYRDEKFGKGKKSFALSFIFLDENKTLTDSEVDGAIDKLIDNFQSQLKATVRS